ncbi:MAG: AlpA family phage regulatory protein [Burkholderiales bacterium]
MTAFFFCPQSIDLLGGIKDGVFPKPVPLGPRAVGWLESDVSDWIAARVKFARDGGRQAA